MVELRAEEWKHIAAYIQSICGLHLENNKRYLIESRLGGLLAHTASPSYTVLCQKARTDATGALERSIINAITTGETSFFRDRAPYELLRYKILPDLIDRRGRGNVGKIPIRIWSMACSSGQEVYSVAIVLREVLGASNRYDVRLIGTDISDEAVRRASLGVFNHIEMSRGMDAERLARYFSRHEDRWKVRDEIRAMASFRTLNLLRDFTLMGRFDIIFCRNVAIYFSEADRISLFERIARSMAPDGYLIVGATESLSSVCAGFVPRNYLRAVFYQRETGLGDGDYKPGK